MARKEVVVVTGASSGVGRAIARRFAAPGVSIGLVARGRDGLDAARREVEAAGGRALALPADVADPAAVDATAQAVEEAFGPIEVWVNDAMTTVFAYFDDIEPEEFRRATEVTYLGTVWGTRGAAQDAAARSRDDRAGRLGDGVPRYPTAVAVLRCEARDQGLLRSRCAASCATAAAASTSRWCSSPA